MANETYRLSLLLDARDSNTSSTVNRITANLQKFEQQAQRSLKAYEKLLKIADKGFSNSGTSKTVDSIKSIGRESAKSERDVDRLTRKVEGLGKVRSLPPTGGTGGRNSTAELDRLFNERERYFRDKNGRLRDERGRFVGDGGGFGGDGTGGRGGGFMGGVAHFNDRYLEPTKQIANVWRENFDSLAKYTDAATRLVRAEAGLKIIGLTPGEQQSAFQFIDRVSKDVRGVSKIDVTKGMVDAVGAFGEVQQAGQFLPSMMRYKMNLSAYFGDEMSPQQVNRQMISSAKALEYIGVTQKGEAETDRWMQEFVRISASTGGRVTPEDILTMLRRGKVATRGLTPEGLRASASLIEDFGAPTAGTAMMSLYQQLVGGQMEQSAVALFQKYGLLREGGFEFKEGTTTAKKVLPGGNILGELMQQNPMEAGKVFLEKLRAGGVNTDNQEDLREIMAVMFQNRNAFAYMDSLVNQRLQIEKEAKRMGVSADTLQQQKLLDTDNDLKRLKQLQEYEAQMENFKISMGQNLIPAALKFMDAATPILEYIGNNPNVAAWGAGILVGAKALSVLAQSASLLSHSGNIVSWFSRTSQAADIATNSIGRTTSSVGKLKGASGFLSNPVPITLQVAAVIGLVEAIEANVRGYLDARDAEHRKNKILAEGGKSTRDFEASTGNLDDRTDLSADEKQFLVQQRKLALQKDVSGIWSNVNQSDDLFQSLGLKKASGIIEYYADQLKANPLIPGIRHQYQVGMNPIGMLPGMGMGVYNRPVAVESFKISAPSLGESTELMKAFLRSVPERIPGNDQKSQSARSEINEILKSAFPEKFKEASQQLTQEQGQLREQTNQLSTAFFDLINPAGNLSNILPNLDTGATRASSSVSNFAGQAESAANRLAAVQFIPPTFSPIGMPTIPGVAVPPVPGRAVGGVVERDGFAYVHAGNVITPAGITRGVRGIGQLFALPKDADARRSPTTKLANLIQVGRDADAARAQTIEEQSNSFGKSSETRSGAPSQSSLFGDLNIPVTIQNTKGLTADDVIGILSSEFTSYLKKNRKYIQHQLAKDKNRDIEKA